MQHIGNDMDELFQRAAENYPLLAGKADWSNIAGRINVEPVAGLAAYDKGKMKKKFITIFLLLFTVPAGWVGVYHFNASKQLPPTIENAINNKVDRYNKLNIPVHKNTGHLNKSIGAGVYPSVQALPKTLNTVDIPAYNFDPEMVNKKNWATSLTIIENDPAIYLNKASVTIKSMDFNKADSLVVANKNEEKTKNLSNKKKHSYFGVVAGPDYSKVRSMAFNRTGIAVGVVAGLYINKKISLETGISWNTKYYDSKGAAFSMDKVGAAMAGMTVDNLSGQSSLIEIPVKVKYDLVNKKRAGLFISGGLSAYIMTKEKNKYNVTMNGNPEKVTGIYNKNNYGLPAVANLSLGYEHQVTPGLRVRIEPFLKIPLKGIGIGSLPISSTGLQIGIISWLK
ncbi:MAG: porin family protein [Ferruginibacter sp.]